MDLILFLLTPVYLVAIFKFYKPSKTIFRNFINILMLLVVPVVIFGGDEIFGQIYLNNLCNESGGVKYKNKITASSYFDADNNSGCGMICLESLTRFGFSFYETEVVNTYSNHAKEKGFYRYSLIDKSQRDCSTGKRVPLEKKVIPEGKCIKSTKIKSPTSRYEISISKNSETVSKLFNIKKITSYLKNKTNNEIIATATSFQYGGGWVRRNAIDSPSGSSCPSFQDSHGLIKGLILTSGINETMPNKPSEQKMDLPPLK